MIAIALIIAMLGASVECIPAAEETLILFYPGSLVCAEQQLEEH